MGEATSILGMNNRILLAFIFAIFVLAVLLLVNKNVLESILPSIVVR